MSACAVCSATGSMTLTRQGLRCGPCLRGENEVMRAMLEGFALRHLEDQDEYGQMAREAWKLLGN